jgi:hypothetical protein
MVRAGEVQHLGGLAGKGVDGDQRAAQPKRFEHLQAAGQWVWAQILTLVPQHVEGEERRRPKRGRGLRPDCGTAEPGAYAGEIRGAIGCRDGDFTVKDRVGQVAGCGDDLGELGGALATMARAQARRSVADP